MGLDTTGYQPVRALYWPVQCDFCPHWLSESSLFQWPRIRAAQWIGPFLMHHQQIAGVGCHNEPPIKVQRSTRSRTCSNLHSKKLSPLQGLLCLCTAQVPHGKSDHNLETLPSIPAQKIHQNESSWVAERVNSSVERNARRVQTQMGGD